MTSDTVAYVTKEGKTAIDKKVDIDDIDVDDNVTLVLDEAIIKAIRVNKAPSAPSTGGGAVSGKKIEAVDTANGVFVYDGEGYKVIATTVLYDKDGNLRATGTAYSTIQTSQPRLSKLSYAAIS